MGREGYKLWTNREPISIARLQFRAPERHITVSNFYGEGLTLTLSK